MTAASIELLTRAGAALLLGCSINVDVIWTILHVLGQHSEARAVVLSSPEDASLSPVSPENVLLEDSHGERVLNPLHDHLSVLTSQSSPLYLVSMGGKKKKKLSKKSEPYGICGDAVYIKDWTYNEASAQ